MRTPVRFSAQHMLAKRVIIFIRACNSCAPNISSTNWRNAEAVNRSTPPARAAAQFTFTVHETACVWVRKRARTLHIRVYVCHVIYASLRAINLSEIRAA